MSPNDTPPGADRPKQDPAHRLAKLERRFKAYQQRTQLVFDSVRDGIVTLDRTGRITSINKAITDVGGYTPEDVVGKRFALFKAFSPQTLAKIIKLYAQRLQGVHSPPYETEMITKTGAKRNIEVHGAPMQAKDGKIRGTVAILRDLTDTKRLEKDRADTASRYKGLFNNRHVPMLVIDPDSGRIIDANPAACKFYGYSYDELTGLDITQINTLPAEKVRAKMKVVMLRKEQRFFFQHRLSPSAGGQIRDVMVTSGPAEVQGKILLYSIVIDVTDTKKMEAALRRSEQRYRSLVEVTSDWVWEVDNHGTYVYCSPKVRDILGYTPEEVLGKTPFDFMTRQEARRVKATFLEYAGRRSPFYGFENVNRHKQGHRVVLETSGVPIFGRNGELTGYRGIDRDISKRKEARELLRQTNEQLEQRVGQRTAELRRSEEELRLKTNNLEEVNTALKVVLKRLNEEKDLVEEGVLLNVKQLILPYIEKLKRANTQAERSTFLEILDANLATITSNFSARLASQYYGLSPSEMKVADLVKLGKSTKEISQLLNLSAKTVEHHRQGVRKKLGITNTRRNLRSILLSLQ